MNSKASVRTQQRWPPTRQDPGEGQETWTLLTTQSWTSSPQDLANIHFCCLSPLVCGIFVMAALTT